MVALAFGIVGCVVWTYLLLARGGFWRARPRDAPLGEAAPGAAVPRVVAIVPARDEAPTIGACVSALLAQDYPGALTIVVVDDESRDGTAAQARAAAIRSGAADRLLVVASAPRPEGWTGKLWALECGLVQARSLVPAPDYVLLTDADIVHAPDSVRALIERTRTGEFRLVSLMARLRCTTWPERALIPAFVFFFQMLYPFAWVNRRGARTAAAAGGCMLLEAAAFERAGGVAAVRGALIDDCALARRMKAQGSIFLGLTDRVVSVRPYVSLTDIRRMVVRSAYAQLRFSPVLLVLTTLGMIVTYVAPPVLAVAGSGAARVLGIVAWLEMTLAFQPTLGFYRVSPWWGVALPAIAAAYLGFTIDSAYQALRGRAGEWKGRVYPVRHG